MKSQTSAQWTDFDLEQYALGELDAGRRRMLDACLADDAELRARIVAIEQSNHAILNKYSAEYMAAQIENRRKSDHLHTTGRAPIQMRSTLAWAKWSYALPVVAVSLLSLVMLRQGLAPHTPDAMLASAVEDVAMERAKGRNTALRIFRKTAQGAEQLNDRESARSGDILQLQYVAEGAAFGMIFSVDGNGTVTHHTSKDAHAIALVKGAAVALNGAYELDNAPRFERFFFVKGSRSFSFKELGVAPQLTAIQADPNYIVSLPAGYTLSSILLNKE